jgi:hypothetical protein
MELIYYYYYYYYYYLVKVMLSPNRRVHNERRDDSARIQNLRPTYKRGSNTEQIAPSARGIGVLVLVK